METSCVFLIALAVGMIGAFLLGDDDPRDDLPDDGGP